MTTTTPRQDICEYCHAHQHPESHGSSQGTTQGNLVGVAGAPIGPSNHTCHTLNFVHAHSQLSCCA
jgi:hypothetical protein